MLTLKGKSGPFEYLFYSHSTTLYRYDSCIAHRKKRSTFLRLHGHQGRLLPHICGLRWARLCQDLVLRVYPRLCSLWGHRDGGTSHDGELQRVCQYWRTVLWLCVGSMLGLEGRASPGTAWWMEIKPRECQIGSGKQSLLLSSRLCLMYTHVSFKNKKKEEL